MSAGPADVVAASNAWIWVPDTATTVETDEYLLVRFPDYFTEPLELLRFRPRRPPETVAAEVLERASGFALPRVCWWVKLDAPPGLDELLLARGGVLDETLDVLALDLTPGVPDLTTAPGVELRWETDLPTARDSHTVAIEVFGGRMPPEERLGAVADRSARNHAEGAGGTVVAYVDRRPVGIGGLSLVDGVARLWGGGVLEAYRRRGLYRTLLAARLDYAVAHGAGLALVKGRVETSGPILRRAGFAAYGQERSYLVPLPT